MRPPNVDCVIHFFPGRQTRLIYVLPGDGPADETLLLGAMLDGLDAFRGRILDPLTAELHLGCFDDWGYHVRPSAWPAQPAWLLRAPLPAGVEIYPHAGGLVVRDVPALTREVLAAWIEEAIGQPPADGAEYVGWDELYVEGSRVRVVEPERFAGRDSIQVDSEIGIWSVPLEWDADGLWITGPRHQMTTQPPIALRFTRDEDGFSLVISIHWSWWTEEGSPGRAAVEESIGRLIARGWQRE